MMDHVYWKDEPVDGDAKWLANQRKLREMVPAALRALEEMVTTMEDPNVRRKARKLLKQLSPRFEKQ